MSSKKLVAYFSCSGVTRSVAQTLADAVGGDLYEITPAQPYTRADLNWMDQSSRSTVEMKDPNSRPEIAGKVDNMADYDTVFVGFPIWWYVAPTIINTFLESYDFSGKTIVPFCSHGGGGFGQSVSAISKLAQNAAIGEGLSVHYSGGPNLADDVAAWLERNGVGR